MFKFSANSEKKLETCELDLQVLMKWAISISDIDFGISHGHRTPKEQNDLYQIGRTVETHRPTITNCDGYEILSKHNYDPSRAVDVFPYVSGRADYAKEYCYYLGGLITGLANYLLKQQIIKSPIRWGGNWNLDGVLVGDQKLYDAVHFETMIKN